MPSLDEVKIPVLSKMLPPHEKEDDVKFIFFKFMPYRLRILSVIGFLIFGLATQLFIHFHAGLFFILTATLLSLVKGYNATPELSDAVEKWNQVTPNEFDKIKMKEIQLRKWDADALDITNPYGLVSLILFVLFFYGCMAYVSRINFFLGQCLAIDAAMLFLPQWFTGVKSYLKRPGLMIKIDLLRKIIDELKKPSNIQVLPMLSTKKTLEGKDVPSDVRLMVRFLNAPEFFLGMQIQISLNTVQGVDYPYLYAVLIAKNEKRFFLKKQNLIYQARTSKIVIENTASEDVDVVVIRQKTTKTSGYHTNQYAAIDIVTSSLKLANTLLGSI